MLLIYYPIIFSFLLYVIQAHLGDQTQVLRTVVTSSNPRNITQQLSSSILGREMTEANAENALARSHSRSRSPMPTMQQSTICPIDPAAS